MQKSSLPNPTRSQVDVRTGGSVHVVVNSVPDVIETVCVTNTVEISSNDVDESTIVSVKDAVTNAPGGVLSLPVAVSNPVHVLVIYCVGGSATYVADDVAEELSPGATTSGHERPSRLALGKPSTSLHFCGPKAML